MTMRGTVVTEERGGEALLTVLLAPKEKDRVRVISAGGLSAADSLARSLLMNGVEKVALVIDADSRDPSQTQDRLRFYRSSLDEVAVRAETLVIAFRPEIESLFFKDRGSLPVTLRDRVTDTDLETAPNEPGRILRKYGETLLSLVPQLTEHDLDRLRAAPEIKSLTDFLSETVAVSRVA